ncbi:unnamed protein product [Haemonchus placei]|uniref:G_PROTEIN_RECEP_F1_2 domain-containing protein n=1 Tax=Haemonchus placei TaxID=6290 RepID=A0A158QN47_HAEPC|nr:unnamed protein product [Haemonchus placei]
MFLTLSDLLYMICITANGLLGISANCFLLYMIVCRSPPQLTPYRIFLANTALTQLLYALVMLMVEPNLFKIRTNMFCFSTVSLVSRNLKRQPTTANYCEGSAFQYPRFEKLVHLAVNSFISIMLSMIFRCVAVLTLGFPTSAAYAMCFLGYFVPLTMVVSTAKIVSWLVRKYLFLKFGQICIFQLGAINMEYVSDYESNDNYMNHTVKYLEHYRTVVGTRVDQACILWVTFCVTFLLVPIYAVMYLCRWKIHHTLSKPTFVQHPSTKVYIRRLVKGKVLIRTLTGAIEQPPRSTSHTITSEFDFAEVTEGIIKLVYGFHSRVEDDSSLIPIV